MTKVKTFKHGHATIEKLAPSGMYLVQVYKGTELHDKVRLDDYRQAQEYFRAFCAIAKAA
jgi:hypothetical protein